MHSTSSGLPSFIPPHPVFLLSFHLVQSSFFHPSHLTSLLSASIISSSSQPPTSAVAVAAIVRRGSSHRGGAGVVFLSPQIARATGRRGVFIRADMSTEALS